MTHDLLVARTEANSMMGPSGFMGRNLSKSEGGEGIPSDAGTRLMHAWCSNLAKFSAAMRKAY